MVWEDEGLYFSLVFNALVLTACLSIGWALHRTKRFHRILRPNRPYSTNARRFEDQRHFVEDHEDEVLRSRGVRPALHVMLLKFMAYLFLTMLLLCILLVPLFATDDYLDRYTQDHDPDRCGEKDLSACSDAKKCVYTAESGQQASGCYPRVRHGLFDWSAQNLSLGETFRLYLFALGCVAICIPLFFVIRRAVVAISATIFKAFTAPVHPHQKYGTLSTVGARTVMIMGLPKKSKILYSKPRFLEYLSAPPQKRKELLGELLSEEERTAANAEARAQGSPRPITPLQEQSQKQKKGKRATNSTNSHHSDPDLNTEPYPSPDVNFDASSWVLSALAVPSSLSIIRCAPKNMPELMKEDEKTIEALKDALAAEQAELDPEKKPVKKRLFPQFWKQVPAVEYETTHLHEVREKLRRKMEKRDEQPMTGVALITFTRASTAAAFVRNFNKERGHVKGFVAGQTARIAGDRDGIIWSNLPVTVAAAKARFIMMVAFFTLLVFFWSVPVGFLGNLQNLENLPGVGPAFAGAFSVVPSTLMGIFTAYLPVILIVVFNLLLPTIFRFFARLGGLKHEDREAKTVLLMCAIFSIMTGIVMQAALQGGFSQFVKLVTDPSGEAVRALIVAIVSPAGGYWFAYLISAACLGAGLRFLLLGPLIKSIIFGKMAKRQEKYDELFEPRETDYPYDLGRHIFFAAFGLLFHGTVPFLLPFSVLYTVMTYFVVHSNMIDGGKRDDRHVYNFKYVLSAVHCILALHTFAAIGNTLVCGLKESIGASIIMAFSIAASVFFHIYARHHLYPLMNPTPETIATMESQAYSHGIQPISATAPYVPDYTTYSIDDTTEATLRNETYAVDKTWPHDEQLAAITQEA
jgi:hypothetical protein